MRLVPTTPDDRYFDYCLQPYEPRSRPEGKLRAETLLWLALELADLEGGRVEAAITAARAHLGRDLTVFGVKHDEGGVFFELYFYDPKKEDERATVSALSAALAPHLSFDVRLPEEERAPYFMWSFDLTVETETSVVVPAVHLYLAAREAQAGRSYTLRGGRAELVNTYRFLHPKREIEEVLHGIRSSVFVDFTRLSLSEVLLPELFDCRRICVAKKREADGIYYSGLGVAQLRAFFVRLGYPSPFVELLDRERGRFDHLSFDVGIDYRMRADGSFERTKSSFYGTL